MKWSWSASTLVVVALATLAVGQIVPSDKSTYPPVLTFPPTAGGGCPQGQTGLCLPLDNTFTIVNHNGPGCAGPANPMDPCQRNDDDHTLAVPLQFNFNLFGVNENTVFINNNGNISFGQPFCTFTPTGFPSNQFRMIAPFWADVDTRAVASNLVWFKSEPRRFTVTWERVGYFASHADKLNTFQVIISDGTDPLVGIGNNVCFCYDDMQWTTGDASGGMMGFGGVPATVGVNAGNGVNFFLIGRFDRAGAVYMGPVNPLPGQPASGIDFLDGRRFCFRVGALGPDNVPPICTNEPRGCLEASVGVELSYTFQWIPPEANQAFTSISINTGGTPNMVVDPPNLGNPGSIRLRFTPAPNQTGIFNISVSATDNHANPLTTTIQVCINVAECFLIGGQGPVFIPLFGEDYLYVLFPGIETWWPVTLESIPTFPIPNNPIYNGISVCFQVLMWNPIAFPNDPLKTSNGLQVTIGQGTTPYGRENGMRLFAPMQPNPGTAFRMTFEIH